MSSLLTEELKKALPKLCAQEGSADPIVFAKFFFPASGWTWFVTEGEAQDADFLFYGYVIGFESEWGHFTLRELEEVDVDGFRIERDILFEPTPFSRIRF
ncbi:MAG TPA: DUF2958 domain-containing protein [Pyrinomonadaceae bacterium]|nr:DUF2958 domain-containing protein [Pyrinomonadaceae bacterium]